MVVAYDFKETSFASIMIVPVTFITLIIKVETHVQQLIIKNILNYLEDDVRRNSDCSEYSWSHGPKSAGGKKGSNSRKAQNEQQGNQESLAASDGELESRDDIGQGTNLDLTGNLPHQQNVGRVSSWAVGFERLLQDPLGLECFTLYLKKEFSDENIMFWIACEQMSKLKDKFLLEKHAQDIYNKYLSPKATSPVNLDSQCRELVEAAINNPTPEMFRTQQQQIFKLMKFDSYSRFLKSKMYQDCVLAEMGGEKLPFMNKHSPKINKPQDPAKLAAVEEKAQKKKSWLPFPNFLTSKQAQN